MMGTTLKKTHYTVAEQLFLFIWTINSVIYIFGASGLSMDYGIVEQLSKLCTYAVLIFQFAFLINLFITQKWKLRKFLQYVLVLALVFIVEVRITDRSLLVLTFFILLGQTIDLDKLLKFDIKLKIILLFWVLSMCALGIVANRTGDFQSGYKMSFGFGHPNGFACYVITILVEWLCIKYKKMIWVDWIAVIAILAIVILVSNARTSVLTFLGILLLYFFANYYPKIFELKLVQAAIVAVTPMMAFISFYLVKLYSMGNEISIAMNVLMSGRIALSYEAISEKGIKMFGQEIMFSSRANPHDSFSNYLIDNAYIRMSLRWGAIIACGIIIMYMFQFVKLMRVKRIDLLLMSLFFVVLGFGESYMINIFFNLSLLCILGASYENKIIENF